MPSLDVSGHSHTFKALLTSVPIHTSTAVISSIILELLLWYLIARRSLNILCLICKRLWSSMRIGLDVPVFDVL